MTNTNTVNTETITLEQAVKAFIAVESESADSVSRKSKAGLTVDNLYYEAIKNIDIKKGEKTLDTEKVDSRVKKASSDYKKIRGRLGKVKRVVEHLKNGGSICNPSESTGYEVTINNVTALNLVDGFTFGGACAILIKESTAKKKDNLVKRQLRDSHIESGATTKEGKTLLKGETIEDLEQQGDNERLQQLQQLGLTESKKIETENKYNQGKLDCMAFLEIANKNDLHEIRQLLDLAISRKS